MDLNGDGHLDILSGSYSRMDGDMAGLFQVLWGSKKGFKKATVLTGPDDEPLILPGKGPDSDVHRICTRPTAADIDGDGDLDLVVGNFTGTFYVFEGKGQGKFEPKATQLTTKDGDPLKVDAHSDPFVVDWDNDGDLDLLSGSNAGGAFLFENVGTKSEPKFARSKTLVKPAGHGYGGETKLGDSHIKGPQSSTRVFVSDVNGDGKLDLLLGDMASITRLAEGVKAEEVKEKLAEWDKAGNELQQKYAGFQESLFNDPEKMEEIQRRMAAKYAKEDNESEEGDEAEEEEPKKVDLGDDFEKEFKLFMDVQEKLAKHYEAREKIVKDDMTGFVWVLYQK